MLPLAEYSRDLLRALRAELGVSYDERAKGILQLCRSAQGARRRAEESAILQRFGVSFELLDRDGCIARSRRSLACRTRSRAACGCPTTRPATASSSPRRSPRPAGSGVSNSATAPRLSGIALDGDRVSGVVTDRGSVSGDAYVVALGSYSPLLLKPIGIRVPVYPVKGYSLTVSITEPAGAPESSVVDETYKVAITRLGDRVRVGGMAELAGYDLDAARRRRAGRWSTCVRDLFPTAGDVANASFWCGLRPMTPDGPPVLGPTRYRNLWLNTGHGTLGWTMACGSGQVLADLISGRTTGHRPERPHHRALRPSRLSYTVLLSCMRWRPPRWAQDSPGNIHRNLCGS